MGKNSRTTVFETVQGMNPNGLPVLHLCSEVSRYGKKYKYPDCCPQKPLLPHLQMLSIRPLMSLRQTGAPENVSSTYTHLSFRFPQIQYPCDPNTVPRTSPPNRQQTRSWENGHLNCPCPLTGGSWELGQSFQVSMATSSKWHEKEPHNGSTLGFLGLCTN